MKIKYHDTVLSTYEKLNTKRLQKIVHILGRVMYALQKKYGLTYCSISTSHTDKLGYVGFRAKVDETILVDGYAYVPESPDMMMEAL